MGAKVASSKLGASYDVCSKGFVILDRMIAGVSTPSRSPTPSPAKAGDAALVSGGANAAARGSSNASDAALNLAREVLEIEADAVRALIPRIDARFAHAVSLLLGCQGRVVVSGIGKSGHIARKVAATFASTGTSAFFVHPAEASHGDLGMVTSDDVFVAFSNSGETAEVLAIAPAIKRLGAKLIALTGRAESTLAKLADAHLDTGVAKEACPMNLAPTASTTAQLAMGDALAVALLDARGFGPQDFARSHPGGALGRRLLTRVSEVMRQGAAVPQVLQGATVLEAVREISAKRMGMTLVLEEGQLVGIFTDGDLRRMLERGDNPANAPLVQVMTRTPQTIGADALAEEAVRLMETRRINALVVTDSAGKPVGALNMHDLFSAKAV
jgi:arabinose-5-phosphate isomerase